MIVGEGDSTPPLFVERTVSETGCVHGGWQLDFDAASRERGEETGSKAAGAIARVDVQVPPPDSAAEEQGELSQLQCLTKYAFGIFLLKLFNSLLDISQSQLFGLWNAPPEQPWFALDFPLHRDHRDGMRMLVEVSPGPAEPGLPEFREFDGCEPRGFEKQGGPGNPSPGSEPAGCSFGECHAAIMGAEGDGFVEP